MDIYSIPLIDSKTQIDWKCPNCNREWQSPLGYRIRKKEGVHQFIGCQECYFNDKDRITPVASIPKHLKQWDFKKNKELGLDPNLTSAHAHTTANWKCKKCDRDYNACPFDMINGYTCPYCNDRQVKSGFNSFADKHSDLLDEMYEIANYLLPKSPYDVLDTSSYKFGWICKRTPEHKYPMSPRNRLMFQKRHRKPCLYCRGLRRKLNHFVLFNKKSTRSQQ